MFCFNLLGSVSNRHYSFLAFGLRPFGVVVCAQFQNGFNIENSPLVFQDSNNSSAKDRGRVNKNRATKFIRLNISTITVALLRQTVSAAYFYHLLLLSLNASINSRQNGRQ
jgi:hypothetical protein